MPRPVTPTRRASSAGPPSTHRSNRRTPALEARTPGAAQRYGGSGRRTTALTPHGRAAIREIESRRAIMTPGKDRRRSGRQQRETPRDILRALSRTLAPTTQRIVSSPEPPPQSKGRFTIPAEDDLDDGLELERPRLSLPLGDEDDEDDSLLLPLPQLASLEDDNFTVQSVELPRRAVSEQPGRYARGSFGSIRFSDRFGDLNDVGSGGLDYDGIDSSIIEPGIFEEDDAQYGGDITELQGENSEILARFNLGQGQPFLSPGRQSDIRPAVLSDDDSQTFAFTIPQRDMVEDMNESVNLLEQVEDNEENSVYEDEAETALTEKSELAEYLDQTDMNLDTSIIDPVGHNAINPENTSRKTARKKKLKTSRYGIQYPSLPAGVVKKLAATFARTGGNSMAKINKETLDAIQQASDWFFEQASEDLGAYSQHAGRKTIDESDVITLLGRQRQTNATTTPFSLAQRYLPRELLQELRMVPPPKMKRGRQLDLVEEEDEG